ncbi:MAG: Rieske 2Fe-2S domain-containing protein [Pirellulales bacterium]|nr:Rieske 2Fe-2S domain-containing protein [Pirellulales bacterium]
MADKKRMSVEEMLAAARKADGGSQTPDSTDAAPADPPPVDSTPAAESAPAKPVPAKSASGGRPSVAEMLAMARAEKSGGAVPAEKKPSPGKSSSGKDAAKPAAKKTVAATSAEPRDTASILAAARKASKAGPMSKAEAAAKSKADPAAKAKKIVVPPLPEKPAYARLQPSVPKAKAKGAADEERRTFLGIGFWSLGAVSALWAFATLKFMFPNVRREPPSKFKVGFPDSFPAGQVQTKFKAQFGVWISNAEYNGQRQLYALKSVCTHLGCTPSWLEAEQKFKCPCHGSGFYKDGINFEGPAPRPLERCAIRIADDGQIEIDKSRTFQEEMGQWEDAACYIPV